MIKYFWSPQSAADSAQLQHTATTMQLRSLHKGYANRQDIPRTRFKCQYISSVFESKNPTFSGGVWFWEAFVHVQLHADFPKRSSKRKDCIQYFHFGQSKTKKKYLSPVSDTLLLHTTLHYIKYFLSWKKKSKALL